MRRLVLVAALAFAFTIGVLAGFDLPGALLIAAYIGVPVALGLLSGLKSLPVVAAAFAFAAVVYQVTLWTDDPELTGIDDLPPVAAIVFVLPFVLVLVFAGAAMRRWGLAGIRRDCG
jgi:hypothetical protein